MTTDTPRTDALKAFQDKEYYSSDYAVRLHYLEGFARELERENVALREHKERLISVLEEMLFQFQTYSRIDMEHAACGEARAAIDAARKDAQL